MIYALFIDDERYPAGLPNRDGHFWTMDPALAVSTDRVGRPWYIARTLDDVLEILVKHGAPAHVSFDHDLGEGTPTGFDIAKALVAADLIARHGPGGLMDGLARGFDFRFPAGFSFTVHSMNPTGAENIAALLRSYLKSLSSDLTDDSEGSIGPCS